MLESARHPLDLMRAGTDFRRYVAPRCDCCSDFTNDRSRMGALQIKIAGRFQNEIERTRAFVEIDIRTENACFFIDGCRI